MRIDHSRERTLIRSFVVLAAIVTVFAVSLSSQARPAQEEGQSAQFLAGTWSCTHTAGDFSGRYTTTYASTIGDRWLKQTYDFHATGEEATPVHADYFLGFDARVQRWVRFGAHSNAQCYGMVGKRADNVWSWTYVLPSPGASAVWTKRSAVEYTVDGPSYPAGGKVITEHHTCRKES